MKNMEDILKQVQYLEKYPELKQHNENAIRMLEQLKEKILNNHQDGIYRILIDDFEQEEDAQYVSAELLTNLLRKDERIKLTELIGNEIVVVLVEEVYMQKEVGMSMTM